MSDGRYTDCWIVIAAYNEAVVIEDVVRELRATFSRVVVVDDGSADETSGRAWAGGASVLRHPINRGQGAALQTGISYAISQGARAVVTFDADGQHRPEDAAALLDRVLQGDIDAVFGDRLSENSESVPAARRLLLRAAVIFSRVTSGMKLHDAHNGLRAFSRAMAAELDITLDGMAHASEIADQVHRSRRDYAELPVLIRYTEHSQAKGQSWDAAFGIAFDYLLGRLLR